MAVLRSQAAICEDPAVPITIYNPNSSRPDIINLVMFAERRFLRVVGVVELVGT